MRLTEIQQGILQLILALAVFGLVLYFQSFIDTFASFGYAGVFVISLISSATIFLPAPGWAIVIALGRVLDPVLVGICAGVGSGIGELTGYVAGSGARNLAQYEKMLAPYIAMIKRYDAIAVFVLAFIPNPLFDVAGLVAGGLGIRWQVFLCATVLGRITRYVLLAYLGLFTQSVVG